VPPVTAVPLVTARLVALRERSPAAYQAVLARIRLIRSDPAHPRARGASLKSPQGPVVHAVAVVVPDLVVRLAWVLVGDEIRLLSLEYDGMEG